MPKPIDVHRRITSSGQKQVFLTSFQIAGFLLSISELSFSVVNRFVFVTARACLWFLVGLHLADRHVTSKSTTAAFSP
jgi:amino acid permease